MVSFLILVFSVGALLKFGISQWRAIWMTTASQPLSESLQMAVGIDGAAIGGQDFGALVELSNKLCPELKVASPWLREVSIYYRMVLGLEQVFRHRIPRLSVLASREMQCCARYVAVLLDQHLAMNLDRQLAARAS
jgi:hypothetical protein